MHFHAPSMKTGYENASLNDIPAVCLSFLWSLNGFFQTHLLMKNISDEGHKYTN